MKTKVEEEAHFWTLVGIIVALAFWILCIAAEKANAQSICVDISVPRAASEKYGGKWIEVTPEQFQFLRGIYVMNPQAPPGLPYGSKAMLSEPPGGTDSGALVFFVDGDKACAPMPIPKELLDLLDKVGSGEITHEGSPM